MSLSLHLLLLLLLVTITTIFSPAHSAVHITHLPGFSGPLPFQLETGYESVGDVEFFYSFVESEGNPSHDPLLLWHTGGPGCSAFNAFFFEIGPLEFVHAEYNGSLPSLIYNPYSWTKVANIIFLDSPIGAGFSFSTDANAYKVDDTIASLQICNFLVKWYHSHPDFLSNPLYIGGDSYAGKIVPIVTHAIVTGELSPLLSNLKGYIIGNPVTDNLFDVKSRVPFAHGMGIISDELYKELEENCEGETYDQPNPRNVQCYKALTKFNQLTSEINNIYILELKCSETKVMISSRRSLGNEVYEDLLLPPQAPNFKCRHEYALYLSYYWTNDITTREALRVKEGTVKEWVRCNDNLPYTRSISSTLMYHQNLIQRGYRALIYSGDHDLKIPFLGTHAWIRSLNFSIIDDWRSWHVDGQVAGYTRKFLNDLTFATVKNAGHTAPSYQPERCFAMFDRWISHERL